MVATGDADGLARLVVVVGLGTGVLVKMAASNDEIAKAVPSTKAEVARTAALNDAVARLSENLTARTKLQNSLITTIDKLEVSKETALRSYRLNLLRSGCPRWSRSNSLSQRRRLSRGTGMTRLTIESQVLSRKASCQREHNPPKRHRALRRLAQSDSCPPMRVCALDGMTGLQNDK